MLATVEVDGAHKRPQLWVFKNGLTGNLYLGEWQHTVKKKKSLYCVLALRCRSLSVSRSLVTTQQCPIRLVRLRFIGHFSLGFGEVPTFIIFT